MHPENIRAGKVFGAHHGFKVCTGVRYLGFYIGYSDIYSTRHLGHGGCVLRSEEDASGNSFASSFIWKEKTLSPILGDLSTMPVKKVGLGLLNPVMSENKNT